MGFLRRFFGGGKKKHRPPRPPPDRSGQKPAEDKRSWSFVKQSAWDNNNNRAFDPSSADSFDPNKHAFAVAAATAAVAEAALAAAHVAAEVVRLTSGGTVGKRPAEVQRRLAEETAAVKIQSAFRGYLARKALRALKGLVKLQALVRGHIVRKQSADMLRRMQTLVRLQARARATRLPSSLSHYPEYYDERSLRAYSTKFDGSSILKRCSSNSTFGHIALERARFGSNWMEESANNSSLRKCPVDDEKSDKILEVDTWKRHLKSNQSSIISFKAPNHYLSSDHYYINNNNNNENHIRAYKSPSKRSSKALNPSLSSRECSRTTENSPQAFSASSSRLGIGARKGPFTPTKSECSWGFFNGYSSHPNYMANTESSRAKVRSHSAPRQRFGV